MHLISDKERLENIKESDIIDAIKGLVGKSETYLSHVDETAIIDDVNWLIEQAERNMMLNHKELSLVIEAIEFRLSDYNLELNDEEVLISSIDKLRKQNK